MQRYHNVDSHTTFMQTFTLPDRMMLRCPVEIISQPGSGITATGLLDVSGPLWPGF